MVLQVILEIVCMFFVILYGWIWRGPRGKTMDPVKRARYRSATLFGLGWAALILVRILTHTYK